MSVTDLLHQAEDHVHARRFAEADALVAQALEREPGNGQAHYVAGLSSLFAKRAADARGHLERALQADGSNPQFHFVLAMSLAELGRTDEAIAAYRRALALRPAFFEALANAGNLLQRTRRLPEAIEAYRGALALKPDEPAVLTALGICELGAGRVEAALPALERAVALRPDSSAALNALGNAVAKKGDLARAIALLRRATQVKPGSVEAWTSLAEQLQAAGDDAAAIAAFDRVLALDPASEEARFRRDAIAGARVDRAPDGFVKNVFDRYAADFDQRLTRDLEYRTPADLAAFLEPWLAAHSPARIVDLGCGTGLSGIAVRAHAARLTGVDLSGKMLEQAAARGIYDELAESDLVTYLDRCAPGSFDLAIAADVLVYIGNVAPLFASCARVLAAGGALAFSTEHLEDDRADFQLPRTGRYVHSRRYVLQAAAGAGFVALSEREAVLRKESGKPVAGRLYAFTRATP